ncbi:MAG: CBS domain-containing protein [Methanophagales archaeon ANME-1-THS]|nr:MAG: CBS domain-containing protein [Methanophagales archaeon ANME-1-THS]
METDIPLKDVMVREVVKGDLNLTILEAAKIMRKYDVDSIVVLDRGEPVGIVTEGDIISEVVSKDLKPSKMKLKDIMTAPLITASPGDRLSDIAKKMSKERIRKIPVIDNGKLVGIVADIDIISVSSEMNSILAELVEMNVERETIESGGESLGQGICEKCGSFSHYLEMADGLMVCETCKEELEMEGAE